MASPLLEKENVHTPLVDSIRASNGSAPSPNRPASSYSKPPSGTGSEPLNIVILGASFGGLSTAHAFLDDTIEKLRTTSTAPRYRLIIISPSTHIYWNIGAPRALVAPGLLNNDDAFIPIEPGFHRHRGQDFTIIQGECKSWDPNSQTITIEIIGRTAEKRLTQINKRVSQVSSPLSEGARTQTVPYHGLIIATGTSAHSDLLSLHGPHVGTIAALNGFHSKVAAAKTIIVGGGGCSGVETAGQLATFLNHTRHFPFKKRTEKAKQIILIAGSKRLLPGIKEKVGKKAACQLAQLGVDVRYDTRVTAVKEDFDLTGQVKVELDDDTVMVVDAYVDCTGVSPNTSFVPPKYLDEKGYIASDNETMRLMPRVFAVGDVASYSNNYVLDVYTAVPVVLGNLLNDLIAHELHLASPYGGNQAEIDALEDDVLVQRKVNSHLCPITRYGGVGWLSGMAIPSCMVHLLKGHDYRVGKARAVVVDGGNPYSVKPGTKYE